MSDHCNPGTTNPADQSYPAVVPPAAPQVPASAATKSSTGEIQVPALRASKAAPSTILGLAMEVNAGHASQVHALPIVVAETLPPAKNINADTNRPSGLPINVNIR